MSYSNGNNPHLNWRDAATYINDYGKTTSRAIAEQEQRVTQAAPETIKLKKVAAVQASCSLVLSAIAVAGALLVISGLLGEITRYGHLISEGAMWETIFLTWAVIFPVPILPLAIILCVMASYRYRIFSKSGGVDVKWKKLNTISRCICLIATVLFILTWIPIIF